MERVHLFRQSVLQLPLVEGVEASNVVEVYSVVVKIANMLGPS